MFKEPSLRARAENWSRWQDAMNVVVRTIRSSGATNALLADGLNTGLTLDCLVPLTDPLNRVLYSSNPYLHKAVDQTRAVRQKGFGNAAKEYPVIVGEWTTAETYYDSWKKAANIPTATAALKMLQRMQSSHIGLVAVR